MLANTSAAMPKFMPDARRSCLRACPDLWPRFQKKTAVSELRIFKVAQKLHSLNLNFWRGWPRKKGTTALSHSL